MSLILNTDSYKLSHFKMYPPKMEEMTSYIEARNGGKWSEVLFFGLQMFIKEYLRKPITYEDVEYAKHVAEQHGEPFNEADWITIVSEFDGYLPIEIEAIKEGAIVPTGVPVVQFRNTDPRFAWLPAYLETAMLRAVWYPSTVATNAYQCKKIIIKYLTETGCADVNGVAKFMLHDFGARGSTSHESAGIGSAAHQMVFYGTDTIEGMLALQKYYSAGIESFSIPAMDHSTVTTWGEEHEDEAFENAIDQYLSEGKILACVIDSYNIERAVEMFCTKFKDKILHSNGRVTIRPDSSDPIVLCTSIVQRLMQSFGYTINGAGYYVLPDCVRVLFGDGIDITSLEKILEHAKVNNIAAENFVFGMGGGLLQGVTRDTLRFACKTNEVIVDGERRFVSKKTLGKESKAGRLIVDAETYEVVNEVQGIKNALEIVYKNGVLYKDYIFKDIRL